MSEIKLNLIDSQQILHGTIHGSIGDACVAALSAEPETITELEAALARYQKPLDGQSTIMWLQTGKCIDERPWDAGIVVARRQSGSGGLPVDAEPIRRRDAGEAPATD